MGALLIIGGFWLLFWLVPKIYQFFNPPAPSPTPTPSPLSGQPQPSPGTTYRPQPPKKSSSPLLPVPHHPHRPTEAELYAAQFDASAYVDVESCRKGFVIVLSFRHFRCSLDANKRKGPARMRRPGKTSHRCAVLNRPRPTSSPSRHVRCAGLCGPQDRGRALAPVDPRARRFSPVPQADRRDLRSRRP